MSRCSDNQSIYDHIRNPNLPRLARLSVERNLDTLQASFNHREKEDAGRLLKKYKVLAILVSGGKVFLLVFVLPFRFTLFTFPKFIFVEILPIGLNSLKPLLNKIDKLKKKFDNIVKKNLLLFVKFKPYPFLLQKLIGRFAKRASERIRDAFSRLTLPIAKAVKFAKGVSREVSQRIVNYLNPAFVFLKKFSAMVRERSFQFTALTKYSALSVRQLFSLPAGLPRLSETAKEAVNKIRQHVSGALASVKEFLMTANSYVINRAQEIKSQILHYAKPFGQTIAQGSRKFTEALKAPVLVTIKGVLNRSQDLRALAAQHVEKFTTLVKNSFGTIQNNFQQRLIPKVLQSIKQSALRFIEGRGNVMVKIIEKYNRGVIAILKSFERIKSIAKEMMDKMNDRRRELFQQFKQTIPHIKKTALACIKIIQVRSVMAFQKFMAFLRALLMFVGKLKIIVHQIAVIGRHLFRELVIELKNWS